MPKYHHKIGAKVQQKSIEMQKEDIYSFLL